MKKSRRRQIGLSRQGKVFEQKLREIVSVRFTLRYK